MKRWIMLNDTRVNVLAQDGDQAMVDALMNLYDASSAELNREIDECLGEVQS